MTLKKAWLVARKDITVEFRTKYTVNFMFLFAFIVLLMFNFAAENPFSPASKEVAPGFLWFVLLFAGLLGLSRGFIREKELGTLDGLKMAPISYSEILLGKTLYNLLLLLLVEILTFPLFVVLFNYTIVGSALDAFIVLTLGVLGFVVVGSFLSAVILGARGREFVLLILVLPLLLPVVIPTIMALREVMVYGTPLLDVGQLKLIIIYVVIMGTLAMLLFDYVLEE
jgi:heme exporter protein B